MHSPESNRQVTLGGAQSFVEGEIWKVDGQTFEIRKTDDGERVQLLVNQDTNLDCAAAPNSSEKKQLANATTHGGESRLLVTVAVSTRSEIQSVI